MLMLNEQSAIYILYYILVIYIHSFELQTTASLLLTILLLFSVRHVRYPRRSTKERDTKSHKYISNTATSRSVLDCCAVLWPGKERQTGFHHSRCPLVNPSRINIIAVTRSKLRFQLIFGPRVCSPLWSWSLVMRISYILANPFFIWPHPFNATRRLAVRSSLTSTKANTPSPSTIGKKLLHKYNVGIRYIVIIVKDNECSSFRF
jgi:hypothetical protein